jgi:hypothetical protein
MRKTLTDDKGKKYEVDVPDDDDESDDDDDDDTIYLDEEDIAWLRRKRLEEADQTRTKTDSSSSKRTSGKTVKIRARSDSSSNSQRSGSTDGRKKVLRLA